MSGPILVDRRAVPAQRSPGPVQKAGQNAQQARLARAVGSDEGERIARFKAKRDAGEDRALAADAGHVVRLETGRVRRAVCTAGNLAPLSGRA